jgi:acyl-homoserine-lactone acylase
MKDIRMLRLLQAAVVLTACWGSPLAAQSASDLNDLSGQVEVIRTPYGVPHIRAENLRGFGYGLAWVQLEDYGLRVALGLLRGRGAMGRVFGRDSMDSDFLARAQSARARAVYPLLDQPTRDVYEGFAAGVNRYITLHRREFPDGFPADFSGYDIATRDVDGPNVALMRRFAARMSAAGAPPASPAREDDAADGTTDPDVGSNAWALGPSRTTSKRAILLRNPHLAWDAGYYEAHASVPGILEFYGDFRIGGPFTVIGGFNRDLGWATTNNNAPQDAIYALDVAPGLVDHVLLDGAAVPLEQERMTVEYRNGPGYSSETREGWRTPLGPVIHRGGGKVYVLRSAGDGEFRGGQQFLRMMRARSLAEWKDAMRMHARTTSNFTYADRAGNIFYVWNSTLPAYPHPLAGDTAAVPVRTTGEAWTRYVPWDSLPQLYNPRGGYLHNENDPPHYTNLLQPLDSATLPANVPPPALSLRSQHALQLLTSAKKRLSLADVARLKHSYRMLLADRVKPDLLRALRAAEDTALDEGLAVLERWDNTAAPASRGGTLFEAWWRRYGQGVRPADRFAEPWSRDDPTGTPRGLADPGRAVTAFRDAAAEVRQRFGSLDVAWGEVHRVRIGTADYPVGGCGGDLGCFRVLQFREDPDGKLVVRGGDGWILAVEFGDTPKAMSVLGYGQSIRPDSPHRSDQAELFAKGELKPVFFQWNEVEQEAVQRYRPGAMP